MTLETFFEKFDTFADAPNAVAKMRELVLELAIRGSLTSESSADVSDPSAPFSIPSDWRWTALSVAADCRAADKVAPTTIPDGAWVLDLEDIDGRSGIITQTATFAERRSLSTKAAFFSGDVLYGKLRPYLNKVIVAQNPGFCTTEIIPLRPHKGLIPDFLRYYLRSPTFLSYAAQKNYGMKMPRLGTKDLESAAIPLPPLAEQKRIVAKVDELMALCDRLEAEQQERQQQHAALARASLARFAEAPTPANLNLLFHKSYAIPPADLRKSILTLAVQGKLVPQDPRDQQIQKQLDDAHKTIERGTGKKPKWASPIKEEEKPYQLPSSWKWIRLGDASTLKHGYAFSSQYFTSEPAPFVLTTPGNFYETGGFRDRESKRKYYSGSVDQDFILEPGALIIPMTEQAAGLLGSPAFIPDDGRVYIHNQRLGKMKFSDAIAPEFAFWFFNSDYFRAELARTCTGMKVRHTSPDRILKVLFPVLPLAEQRRIVSKVDELMALVDALETQLATVRTTASDLLDALVAELANSPYE